MCSCVCTCVYACVYARVYACVHVCVHERLRSPRSRCTLNGERLRKAGAVGQTVLAALGTALLHADLTRLRGRNSQKYSVKLATSFSSYTGALTFENV